MTPSDPRSRRRRIPHGAPHVCRASPAEREIDLAQGHLSVASGTRQKRPQALFLLPNLRAQAILRQAPGVRDGSEFTGPIRRNPNTSDLPPLIVLIAAGACKKEWRHLRRPKRYRRYLLSYLFFCPGALREGAPRPPSETMKPRSLST